MKQEAHKIDIEKGIKKLMAELSWSGLRVKVQRHYYPDWDWCVVIKVPAEKRALLYLFLLNRCVKECDKYDDGSFQMELDFKDVGTIFLLGRDTDPMELAEQIQRRMEFFMKQDPGPF